MIKNLPQFRCRADESREIRVFISSTFRDMADERSALVHLFTRLRPVATDRGVSVTLVDLRWGITEDESKSGKVMQICLDEIVRSRPFFIGLVGNRYGWRPSHADVAGLLESGRYEWLRHDIDDNMSVTEIEMQFGVLRNPATIEASFYLKGDGVAEDVDADETARIARLRADIEAQTRYPVTHYDDEYDLVDAVEQSFMKMLDRLYPNESLNPDDRLEVAEQRARFDLLKNYIPVEAYDEMFNSFTADDSHRVLSVTGESGTGKSALLAHWSDMLNNDASPMVIYHRLDTSTQATLPGRLAEALARKCRETLAASGNESGVAIMRGSASPDATYANMLAKLREMGLSADTLEEFYGENVARNIREIEYDMVAVRSLGEFGVALQKLQIPVIILIDDIGRLVDADGELPPFLNSLPSGVKVVLSDSNADAVPQTDMRLTLDGFDDAGIRAFVRQGLARHAKALSAVQEDMIATWPPAANAQVLATLLAELVRYGDFDTLTEYIAGYVSANDAFEFCDRVLARLRAEYRAEALRMPLLMLALSSQGFTENEIKLIGDTSQLLWSQLREELWPWLREDMGQYRFADGHMRQAVVARFASDATVVVELRRHIVDSLSNNGKAHIELSMGDYNSRMRRFCYRDSYRHVVEVVWQLLQLGDVDTLWQNLIAPEVFEVLYRSQCPMLAEAWRTVMATEPQHTIEVYTKVDFSSVEPALRPVIVNDMAHFVSHEFDMNDTANAIGRRAMSFGGVPLIAQSVLIMNQGCRLARDKHYAEACMQFKEALAMQEEIMPLPLREIANTCRNMALAYFYADDEAEARLYAERAYGYYNTQTDSESMSCAADCIEIMASASYYIGQYDTAAEYFPEAIRSLEIYQGRTAKKTILSMRRYGECLFSLGRYDESLQQFGEALCRATEAGNDKEIRECHNGLYTWCAQASRDAIAAGNEALGNVLFNESCLHQRVADPEGCVLNSKNIRYEALRADTIRAWYELQRYDDVLRVADTLDIGDKSASPELTAHMEHYIALSAYRLGDKERALKSFTHEYDIRRILGQSDDLVIVARNLAIMCHETGDNIRAITLLREALVYEERINGADSATVTKIRNEISYIEDFMRHDG